MATGGKQRDGRAERERVRVYQARQAFHAGQARRRYERRQQRVDSPPRASAAAQSTASSRQQAVVAALARARARAEREGS